MLVAVLQNCFAYKRYFSALNFVKKLKCVEINHSKCTRTCCIVFIPRSFKIHYDESIFAMCGCIIPAALLFIQQDRSYEGERAKLANLLLIPLLLAANCERCQEACWGTFLIFVALLFAPPLNIIHRQQV